MTKLEIHVGEGVAEMGRRFVAAWRRAEAGEPVEERHLTFASFQDAARVLSTRRLGLLHEIRRRPARSVRQLAEALGRGYKNVHADVGTLLAAGVLDRDELGGLSAGYAAIAVEIAIVLQRGRTAAAAQGSSSGDVSPASCLGRLSSSA